MNYGRIIKVPKADFLKDDLDPAIICPHCSAEIKLSSLAKRFEDSGYHYAIVAFGIYECGCGGRYELSDGPTVKAA